jgi:hypothetical protein
VVCGCIERLLRPHQPLRRLLVLCGGLWCAAAEGETLEVRVASVARDGEANEELCRFLTEVLQLKKKQVTLIKGQKARAKVR